MQSPHENVPPASSAAINNAPPIPERHASHRHTSSASSFSSTSVTTAKRASSISAGGRRSQLSTHDRKSGDAFSIASRVGPGNAQSEHRRRGSATAGISQRPSTDGLENVNRWSRSTTSSVASNTNQRRSRASSGSVLPALLQKPLPNRPPHDTPLVDQRSSRSSVSRPMSPQHTATSSSSSEIRRRPMSNEEGTTLTALPPLHTTPSLIDSNEAETPSTFATVATPTTFQSPITTEYFSAVGSSPRNSPRNSTKGKQPMYALEHPLGPKSSRQSDANGYRGHARMDSGSRSSRRNDFNDPQPAATPLRVVKDRMSGRSRQNSLRNGSDSGLREYKRGLLQKALDIAHHAVYLDSNQEFELSLQAYSEACNLLIEVSNLGSGDADRTKLESIRKTYLSRMSELREMGQHDSREAAQGLQHGTIMGNSGIANTAQSATMADHQTIRAQPTNQSGHRAGVLDDPSPAAGPPLGQSFDQMEPIIAELPANEIRSTAKQAPAQSDQYANGDDARPLLTQGQISLSPPGDRTRFMPRPLSPKRPSELGLRAGDASAKPQQQSDGPEVERGLSNGLAQVRESNNGEMSWLGTIDGSGRSSRASSIHSRSSIRGLHRRPIPQAVIDTDPDFDAAFDAAVEAAYDEGLEPDLDSRREVVPATHRRLPPEPTTIRNSAIQEIWSPSNVKTPPLQTHLDTDDEDEERILDELTSEFAQTYSFDVATHHPNFPRQSDSSGFSRSTWESSFVSDRTTAGTSLSTVAEDTLPPQFAHKVVAPAPSLPAAVEEPQSTLALPQTSALARPTSSTPSQASTVRNRRLSGNNPKQLKIETTNPPARNRASTYHLGESPFREEDAQKAAALGLDASLERPHELPALESARAGQYETALKSPPSLSLLTSNSDGSRPTTARTTTTTTTDMLRNYDDVETDELLTTRPSLFRKNKSSPSLREHTVLLSPTDHMPPIVPTPMSSTFLQYGLKRHEGPLTSQRANFPSLAPSISNGSHVNNFHLFDTSLTRGNLPTSPRSIPSSTSAPPSLEPCQELFSLRPFWLMRVILATLTHPKGGYLTTRVFLPREIWKTPAVKLKAVEDKIANCDLLTAALGRLGRVDTNDADAVMEEMQTFEDVMERVQAALAKKLGSEVGSHGLAGLFKDAAAAAASSGNSAASPDGSVGGAGVGSGLPSEKPKAKENKYLNSWRKLRSKSSGVPVGGAGTGSAASAFSAGRGATAAEKEALNMPTVPMTASVSIERRGQRRDASRDLAFDGPWRNYMTSLVKLFEGTRILDQIARQAEDPGLRGTSPTHVGLELSIRHAAEFFGFYICRFVLADLGLLLEKYLKRGTRWVED